MLLVDHDEAQVLQRRQDGRARADGDFGVTYAQPPPRVVALAHAHLRVQNGDLALKVRTEALDGLGSEGNFRNEDDGGTPLCPHGLERADIHLRLAAASDAVEKESAVVTGIHGLGDGIEGLLLGGQQVVVGRRVGRRQIVEGRTHHLLLHPFDHALLNEASNRGVGRVGPFHHVGLARLRGALCPKARERLNDGLLLFAAQLLDQVRRGALVLEGRGEAEVCLRLSLCPLIGECRLHLNHAVALHATDERERYGWPQALPDGREGRLTMLPQVGEHGPPRLMVGPRARIGRGAGEATLGLDGRAGGQGCLQRLSPAAHVVVGNPLREVEQFRGAHRHIIEQIKHFFDLKVERVGRRALAHNHTRQAPVAKRNQHTCAHLRRTGHGIWHAVGVGLVEWKRQDNVDGHKCRRGDCFEGSSSHVRSDGARVPQAQKLSVLLQHKYMRVKPANLDHSHVADGEGLRLPERRVEGALPQHQHHHLAPGPKHVV